MTAIALSLSVIINRRLTILYQVDDHRLTSHPLRCQMLPHQFSLSSFSSDSTVAAKLDFDGIAVRRSSSSLYPQFLADVQNVEVANDTNDDGVVVTGGSFPQINDIQG